MKLANWDISIPAIPERREFTSIKPIGIGTSTAEKLCSYLTRVADEHDVRTGTLIREAILPAAKKYFLEKNHQTGPREAVYYS